MRHFFTLAIIFSLTLSSVAQTVVKIDATKSGDMLMPFIYGQFIEHLGRCINGGGIWAEMLEDRKFYHPVGSGESPWKPFGEVNVVMEKDNPFVGEHSPKIVLSEEKKMGSIMQRRWALQKDRKYTGYIWLKCEGAITDVRIMFDAHFTGRVALFKMIDIPVKTGDYYRHEFEFDGPWDAEGQLTITIDGTGSVTIGCVSLMPADNVHGMRADTLVLLKRLDSPIYRWPGGNFVSGYDWQDGIGDRDKRPPRKNPAWKGIEPNDFGLDEFMQFCYILNTEPYIAVNTGDGNVENAVKQLEYANGTADTPMGKRRAENGHADPYGVIFWGIGNEMYGDWQIGHMPVEEYVKKNNAFVDAFRAKDPKVRVIAVGSVGKWDEAFLPGAAEHMDLISEHFYVGNKPNVTEHVRQITNSIKRIADAHRKYRVELPKFKDRQPPVWIALDEWNYWYGEHVFGELGTRYFMKDGLGVAAGIHEFARQADMYCMANYAQTVNVIGAIKTSKTAAQMETTGLALELYRRHFGNVAVQTEHSNAALDIQAALIADGIEYYQANKEYGIGSGIFNVKTDLKDHRPIGVSGLTVGIVNTSDKEETINLDISGYDIFGKPVRQYIIADPQNDPMGFNDPDKVQRISITERLVESPSVSGVQRISVMPYSITLVRWGMLDLLPKPSSRMLHQVERLKVKGIPLTDYHIHIRGGMTPEKAFDWAQKTGIRSGVLENHGREWPLSDNDKLKAFIEDAQKFPELLVGIQVNDRDWFRTIDPALRAKLDYVLADTMIMDGQRLWFENDYKIDDENAWLERYFAHCMTVVNEPITILANPTYLPEKMVHRYDDFWSDERMGTLIDAAVKNNVALEIQAGTKFPNKKFIELALAKGAKISIGRNNFDDKPNELKRSLDWLEELNIKPENMLDLKREPNQK